MLTCNIEFDNDTASPLSPLKFIEHYVFNTDVEFVSYTKKTKTAIYHVFSKDSTCIPRMIIMIIRLKNLEQI